MALLFYFTLLSSPLLILLPHSTCGSAPKDLQCNFCLTLTGEDEKPKECKPDFKQFREIVLNRTQVEIDQLGGSGQPDVCITMIKYPDQTKHSMKLSMGIQKQKSSILKDQYLNGSIVSVPRRNGQYQEFKIFGCDTNHCNLGQRNLAPKILPVLVLGLCLKYLISMLM